MSTTVTQTTTGEVETLAVDRAARALARDADRRLREPRASEGRRAQGRRSPGVVGLDGVAHDRPLLLGSPTRADRVSVKPHASPVLHALEYLLGRLDRGYLTMLRDFGGLQSLPVRTKDPFPVDYSTGSVGLGSAAPLSARSPTATSRRTSARHRRALHLPARRRRARRGQHLGGVRRAADAGARQRRSGSST